MGTPRTGNKIGNYLICEQIGGGAMGRVWRGIDEALGRAVAIKMLRTELADHPELIERFRVEARALARLNHPNIATVFALVEDGDELYLVMEYVQGQTLHAALERRGPLPFDEALPILHQALDGIQHAHESGVVHRDIKASNLMLTEGGSARWIDFGIARLDGQRGATRTGGLMGTPEYMAPEQVRGEAGTVQSDVYSLGVLLYKLLSGRSPFSAEADFDMMRAHVETPPPRLSELGVAVSEELEGVILRALDKSPGTRFQSARAFQDALVEAGAPKPARPMPVPILEGESTLCDAPPPELTRPLDDDVVLEAEEIPATVPDIDLDELRHEIDPDAPTRIDPDAPTRIDPETRARGSRFLFWLGAAIVAGGLAIGANWIVTTQLEELAAPASLPEETVEAAPAPPAAEAEPTAETPPPEPAGQGTSESAPEGPQRAPGWEVVR